MGPVMPQSRRKVGRCGGGFEGDMQAGRCVRRKCYEPYELRETVVVRRNGPLASSFLSRETRSMVAVAPTQFSHSGAFKETVLADAGVAAATFLGCAFVPAPAWSLCLLVVRIFTSRVARHLVCVGIHSVAAYLPMCCLVCYLVVHLRHFELR